MVKVDYCTQEEKVQLGQDSDVILWNSLSDTGSSDDKLNVVSVTHDMDSTSRSQQEGSEL